MKIVFQVPGGPISMIEPNAEKSISGGLDGNVYISGYHGDILRTVVLSPQEIEHINDVVKFQSCQARASA